MSQTTITLRPGHGTSKNVVLRSLPLAAAAATTTIWLYALHATPKNVVLRDPTVLADAGGDPSTEAGLRVQIGSLGGYIDLPLVAVDDAPPGPSIRVQKGGVTYALYTVETSDPNASPIRVRMGGVTKAVRMPF